MSKASTDTPVQKIPPTRPNLDNPALADLVTVCIDCGASVFEWSTPEVDRCWQCAEALDAAGAEQ